MFFPPDLPLFVACYRGLLLSEKVLPFSFLKNSVNKLCKFFHFMFDSSLSLSTLKFVKVHFPFSFVSLTKSSLIHFVSCLLKAFGKLSPNIPRYICSYLGYDQGTMVFEKLVS